MTDLPKRALSIRQPWAWLIAQGFKDIENRDWKTAYRGPVLIHASKKLEAHVHQALLEGIHPVTTLPPLPEEVRLAYTHAIIRGEVHRGGIIGVATVGDCVTDSRSDWFVGDYGFTMSEASALPFMPVNGSLGFFKIEYQEPAA